MFICPELLFDGTRILRGKAARVENGIIAEITEAPEAPDALCCHILAPGFIDLHIHGCLGEDTMRGEQSVRAMARALPRFGVTAFAPTTMAAALPDTRAALKGVAKAMRGTEGARVLGCHLEGPFLNAARRGAQPERFLLPPSLSVYGEIAGGLEQAVLLMTIAPELAGADEVIRALAGKIALSAGHTDATCEQMARAAELGVTQVTHLFNGMNPLAHRFPGVPGAALTVKGLRVQLIADLLHLHPTALRLCWSAKGPGGCILITDAMEAAGMPDGEYTLGANRVFVRDGAARLAEGNLAGSTLTMDRAVRNMAGAAGAGLSRALRMATRNPADALSRKDMGRAVPGAKADLTLLDGDLRVIRTLVGGETAYCST